MLFLHFHPLEKARPKNNGIPYIHTKAEELTTESFRPILSLYGEVAHTSAIDQYEVKAVPLKASLLLYFIERLLCATLERIFLRPDSIQNLPDLKMEYSSHKNINNATTEPISTVGKSQSREGSPRSEEPIIRPTIIMLKASNTILKDKRLPIRSSFR